MNLSQGSQLAEYGYFNPVKSVVTICSTIVDIKKLPSFNSQDIYICFISLTINGGNFLTWQ